MVTIAFKAMTNSLYIGYSFYRNKVCHW